MLGTVESNALVGEKFRWLKLNPEKEFIFQPGQYLLIKINEGKENSYSICSLPGDEPIEAIIDVDPAKQPLPFGEGTRYINDLKPGDQIEFSGPFGKFTLQNDDTDYKVFVATGSGISSILPLAQKALEDSASIVILFWGLRLRENIFLQDKLEWLKERYLNFHFEIVLSQPDREWDVLSGHVTENVKNWLESKDAYSMTEVSVYLCGNSQMIQDVKAVLQEVGVLPDKIYFEKYYEDF